MYAQEIVQADQTLTDSRRICAETIVLRAQTNALLLKYRAHRFPRLSGGSGPTDSAAMMRSKIGAGVLPRPADAPEKCWAGKGTRQLCHGCAVAIAPEDVEYELDIAGGGTLVFCATCLAAWNGLREERIA